MNSLNMLLVDDDPTFLEVVEALLKTFGITRFTRSHSGREAYRALAGANGQINCVLCDIAMEDGSGIEFLQAVRAGKTAAVPADIPVILVTGVEDDKARQTARDLGASGFLLKPVTAERLRDAIHPRRMRDVFQPIRGFLER